MSRRLLSNTPPGPSARLTEDDVPKQRKPIPARRSLITLFAVIMVAWVAIAGVGGPYFGKISEVATNDRSSFLPESAESTKAQALIDEFSDLDYVPAIVVLENKDGVSKDSTADFKDLAKTLDDKGLLAADASPVIPSEDGDALELILPVSTGTTADDVEQIRSVIGKAFPTATADDSETSDDSGNSTTSANVYVTGPGGFSADLTSAFAGIDGILLLVALIAVFVILLIVYRSPLLPVIVLFTSVAALAASIFVVWHLADAGILLINGQVQGILFILVVGATTDYSLLVVARFRDALLIERDRVRAGLAAFKGVLEPIAASGGTVIASLLVLLLTDLASTRALGPVAAIGIVMAMFAALTFLPAALMIIGRAVFWPFRPQVRTAQSPPVKKGLWNRIAEVVAKRPRVIWIGLIVLLALPLIAFPQFKASGIAQSDFVLGESEARDGQAVLSEHFPGGSGSPTQIVVAKDQLEDVAKAVGSLGGVESMTAVANDSPSGTVAIDDDGQLQAPQGQAPQGQGGPDAQSPPATPPAPTKVDGQVLLEATLSDAADSLAAEGTVTSIRDAVHDVDPDALVGGETAVDLDTNATAEADRTLAIPLILVVITIVLILLLRSLVAPLLLVALTVLSFGTALGVSALVFNHLIGFPGADPSVPLYAFVFLVALGIDYNIFLMSRVREESLRVGTRKGVLSGLVATGGVITSAGVVLATTFAALAVIPVMFLFQLAFIVTFGVLLDAILVRSLVVPALVHDIGRSVWWPWRKRIPLD